MPGEVIDRPNPEPLPSNVPDSVRDLAVKLDKLTLPENANASLKEFRRAACYIAADVAFAKTGQHEEQLKANTVLSTA
ncbi:hypothetical protein LTR16_012310, partial [Cryomyces antarcticus]